MYDPSKSDEYKRVILSAIDVYDLRKEMIFGKLDSLIPSNSEELMKYISYIYCYVYMCSRIGLQIEQHRSFVNEYVENASIVERIDDNRKTLSDLYHAAVTAIPVIMSQDIHLNVAFPRLPSVQPISSTGTVGPSEIYIAGLLNDFAAYNNAKRYVQIAIEHILRLSVASEELTLHYEGVLRSEVTSGGFVKTHKHISHINYSGLVETYIDYLKGDKRYNQVQHGKMQFNGCGDTSVCTDNLKYIVAITGRFKEVLRDYEEYCMRMMQEENAYDSEDEYYTSRIMQMMIDKKGPPN